MFNLEVGVDLFVVVNWRTERVTPILSISVHPCDADPLTLGSVRETAMYIHPRVNDV